MNSLFSVLGQVAGSVLESVESEVSAVLNRANASAHASRQRTHTFTTHEGSVVGAMAFAEGSQFVGSVGNGSPHSNRTKQVTVTLREPIPQGFTMQSLDLRVVSNPHFPDRFSAEARLLGDNRTLEIVVRREDAPHGWGQEISVEWQLFIAKVSTTQPPPLPQPSPHAPPLPPPDAGAAGAGASALPRGSRTTPHSSSTSHRPMELFDQGTCVVGSVGNGSSRTSQTKAVVVTLSKTIPHGRTVGRLALRARSDPNVGDRFSIMGQIKDGRFLHMLVRRTDAPHGWGQNLKADWQVFLQSEDRKNSKSMDELVVQMQDAGFPRLSVLDAIEVSGCGDADAVVSELCANPVFAHLSSPRLRWASEEEVFAHWTATRGAGGAAGCLFFSEFKPARQRVIVSQELWGSCATADDIRVIDTFIVTTQQSSHNGRIKLPPLLDEKTDATGEANVMFAKVVTELIIAVFNDVSNAAQAKHKRVDIKGYGNEFANITQGCSDLFRDIGVGWRRVLLFKALYVLLIKLQTNTRNNPSHLRGGGLPSDLTRHVPHIHALQTEIKLFFALLVRASGECMARKYSACSDVVRAVAQDLIKQQHSEHSDLMEEATPESTIKHRCAKYIDEIKERALRSVFLEPAKLVARAAGDGVLHDDVDVHGSNTYKALLTAALGVGLPDPGFGGDAVKGVCDALEAAEGLPELREAVEQGLWASKNLGRSFESISKCTRVLQSRGGRVHAPRYFVFPSEENYTALEHANCALDPARRNGSDERRRLAVYLNQYASYFTRVALLERLVAHLTVADDSGQGLALLELVAQRHGLVSPGGEVGTGVALRSWLYDEDHRFQADRASLLFSVIGVVDECYMAGVL